jgi:hypothetical protein
MTAHEARRDAQGHLAQAKEQRSGEKERRRPMAESIKASCEKSRAVRSGIPEAGGDTADTWMSRQVLWVTAATSPRSRLMPAATMFASTDERS